MPPIDNMDSEFESSDSEYDPTEIDWNADDVYLYTLHLFESLQGGYDGTFAEWLHEYRHDQTSPLTYHQRNKLWNIFRNE